MSEFLGKIGNRLELFVKVMSNIQVNSRFGPCTMNICVDRNDNTIVYVGKIWNKGDYYHIKGTVKRHHTFRGIDQTFINRPSVIEVKNAVVG